MRFRRLLISASALVTTVLAAAPALAADGDPGINPGVRIGQWIYTNVTALFAPILAGVAIYYLVKRQFTKFLAFAVFAAFASFLIFGADQFKNVALSFSKWAFGQ